MLQPWQRTASISKNNNYFLEYQLMLWNCSSRKLFWGAIMMQFCNHRKREPRSNYKMLLCIPVLKSCMSVINSTFSISAGRVWSEILERWKDLTWKSSSYTTFLFEWILQNPLPHWKVPVSRSTGIHQSWRKWIEVIYRTSCTGNHALEILPRFVFVLVKIKGHDNLQITTPLLLHP